MAISKQDIKNSYTRLGGPPDGVSKDTIVSNYGGRGFGSLTSNGWSDNNLHEVDGRFYYSEVRFKYTATVTSETGEAFDDVIRPCGATVTGRIQPSEMRWYEVYDLKAFRLMDVEIGEPLHAREVVNNYRYNTRPNWLGKSINDRKRDNLLHA